MTKGIRKIYVRPVLVLSMLVLGIFISLGIAKPLNTVAAGNGKETVNIRIIGTTDLHGQLNSKDYEQGVDNNNGGLARVFDLIKKTKAELPEGNTITLDAGDVLFDYTTEYIFSANQEEIQPIYKAMKKVGYDAITLGNHEFDYGYDYLLRQLDGSGLRDITVVSNVTDARTGEHPFQENMLITRLLKTSHGNEVEVKIGIIGQTIPTLTGKTHSYTGILYGEDMVVDAKEQAVKLKEMGADIIVALSHTGIGPENPELNFKNVAYALTKIPEIDAVIAGHEHNLYPTTDMSSPYFKLPGVDKSNYLINGKNVVMAGDRGKAIGVIDLTLEVKGDYYKIADRQSSLRMVNEKTTNEDMNIATMYGEWEDDLLHYATDILFQLESDTVLQNYFGLLADNAAIQLLNDSKIHYAINRINATQKDYIDYPIIAASTYESFGVKSVYDFVNIKDRITEANLAALQNYNSYLYVYTITGAQLKEWLEWSASAYETIVRNTSWQDPNMSDLMNETDLRSLISEEWLNDWSNFYVFDGISYEIDPSKDPRYDLSGNRISSNKRIANVYYQGKEVSDDMEFLIATNKITKPTSANREVEGQSVLRGFVRSQAVLAKYISQLSKSEGIVPQVDYNWRLVLPRSYQFIVKIPYYSDNLFRETTWYKKYLTQKDKYGYYIAEYLADTKDITPPHIVISPLVTNPTASPYDIVVQAFDDSEIKYLKYVFGEQAVDDNAWRISKDIPSKGFQVASNGIYSIYAEDIHGNKLVRRLVVDNFNDNLLPKPEVDNYTNRKKNISGRAEPNTVLVIETPSNTYEERINRNGTFSVSLPGQLAETYITLYVKDDERGLESERVEVRINRTGPNQPIINPLYNNINYIIGNARDNITSVVAIIDNVAYVSRDGGKELFENNKEIYDPKLKIIETTMDISNDGQFIMILPPQKTGTSIMIYSIDHVSRNSRVTTIKVEETAPNAPVINEVSNIERSITGYVPATESLNVILHIGDNVYTTKTDKNGKFSFTFDDQLYAGQSLVVVATDIKEGKERNSYPIEVIVNDIEAYVKPNSTNLTLNRITNKSNLISGFNYSGGNVNVAISNGEGMDFRNNLYSVSTNQNDRFIHYLDEKLEIGTKVYAMLRFVDGRILLAQSFTVAAGRPDTPNLLKDITNTDKTVYVVASKDVEITLLVGNKRYTTNEYYFDQTTNQYIYSLKTDRDLSGTTVVVTASNESGTSDPLVTMLVKASPDSPMVNQVYEGDEVITGSIELLDYIDPETDADEISSEVAKEFKNAAAEVARTQTKVYAQIGSKKYKVTIDNNGDFTINIPKQEEGTPIKLWGVNKAGRGPLVKIIVKLK